MTESNYRIDDAQSNNDQCLSDLQLAALIDNSLKSKEKQQLMQHLNRCEDCRFVWMEASISMPDATVTQDKLSWSARLRKCFTIDFMPPKLTASVAMITAAFFCALVLFPLPKGVEPLLDEQYAVLIAQAYPVRANNMMKNMPLPWEHAAFSFAPNQLKASELAFASGLVGGRNTLSSETGEPLPDLLAEQLNSARNAGEDAPYYQLGRWMASLWFVSQLDNESVEWWNNQTSIMAHFNSVFSGKNESDLQAAKARKNLQRIKIALKEIQLDPLAKEDLRRQVERVMIQLSPDSLGK